MPALIGGFGNENTEFLTDLNKDNITKEGLNINSMPESNLKLNLGSYLAGLIEADGSFAIHDKDSKAKKYLPKIIIVFNLADIPLAEKLISITQVGKLYKKPDHGCAL
jgi:hypothetical protein